MADEKAEEKTEQPAAKPEKKKPPLLLIIIIVVAGLAIGGGGAVTYMMLKGKPTASSKAEEGKEEKQHEPAKEKGGHGGSSGKKEGSAHVKAIEPSFIVNLAGGSRTYLKVDVALELSGDKGVESELEGKLPMIKDTILMVLSEQTPDSIADNKGKLRLKDELLKRINMILKSGKVMNIYFTSFVVQ